MWHVGPPSIRAVCTLQLFYCTFYSTLSDSLQDSFLITLMFSTVPFCGTIGPFHWGTNWSPRMPPSGGDKKLTLSPQTFTLNNATTQSIGGGGGGGKIPSY